MTVPETNDKERFSGQLAIDCLLIENQDLSDLLDRYAQERGEKIKPALVTVKSVLNVLALRTFYKFEYKLTCVNETREQIAASSGLGLDAIQNALGFLTWAGFSETINRGGGKNHLPTVRKVYSTTAAQRDISRPVTPQQDGRGVALNGNKPELDGNRWELDGNRWELDGNRWELDGNRWELDGVLPVTPSSYQVFNQVFNQVINKASIEKIDKTLLFGDQPVQSLIPHQDDPAPNDIAVRMAMEQAKAQIAADRAEKAKQNRTAPAC